MGRRDRERGDREKGERLKIIYSCISCIINEQNNKHKYIYLCARTFNPPIIPAIPNGVKMA